MQKEACNTLLILR